MRQNVTSSTTIFWKIFVPTFWFFFMGTITLALLTMDIRPTGIPKSAFNTLAIVTMLLGTILFSFTIIRLKRVEMDENFFYITNYFKWYKYPYHNVEEVIERDWILAKVITIVLKEKGSFGKKIHFLANHRKLNEFLQENPNTAQELFEKHS